MWQSIYADLKDRNFVVIAIAMDDADAARPWIEAAKPTYPCLIDRDHHVADLYNMVNVPQATWIDEQGRIVRPPENAGSSDAFRHMDRATKQMTADQLAERERIKSTYVAAVRDWALKGAASEFVYDPAAARARLKLPDEDNRERARPFPAGALSSAHGKERRSRASFRGGEPAPSGVVEHLASIGAEGRDRPRRGTGVLGAGRCARRSPLPSSDRHEGDLTAVEAAGKKSKNNPMQSSFF